jgi:uncharacterized protein (TIGR02246 family)
MKMRSIRVASAIAVVIGLTACAPAPPPDTSAADLAAIAGVRDAWAAAFAASDAAALTALYSDDAARMNPGQPTVSGRAAIQANFEQMFSEATGSNDIQPELTEVSGDWGFDIGTYTSTVTPKAGGDAMTENGRYLVVLRKQADGSWKIVREMGNTPTAPMMPGGGN